MKSSTKIDKLLDWLDDLSMQYFLWLYENIIHLFGVLGIVFTMFSLTSVFTGNFVFALLLLITALLNLWLDILIKEND